MSISKFLKSVKTDDWIGRSIEQAVRENPQTSERWEKPNILIRPSYSGSPCPRSTQLTMLGYRTSTGAVGLRRMANGTGAHLRWEKELQATGLVVATELRLKAVIDGVQVRGQCDAVLKNPETGTYHVGDVKTINRFGYAKLPAQLENRTAMTRQMLAGPHRGYIMQLSIYVELLQRSREELGYMVDDEAFFLFEDTDTQNYKALYVKLDESVRREAIKAPLEAARASREGILLDPPFKRTSPTCRACYQEAMCYRLQDGDEASTKQVNEALEKVAVKDG